MNFVKSLIKVLFALLLTSCLVFSTVSCNNENDKKEDEKQEEEKPDEKEEEVKNRVVNGIVTDGVNPVSGATVKIRNTNYQVTTDAEGKFTFEITESTTDLAEFRVMVSCEGFASKTYDVTVNSFTDSVANITISLISSKVTLKGVVKNANGACLEGVNVSIASLELTTTTNDNGEYSFNIDRPMSVVIEFGKDYYKTKSVEIADLSTGSEFVNDVTLEDNKVTVSGIVSNYYSGAIAGAKVTIEGTEFEAVSDSDGKYTISDCLVANEDFKLTATKEGFLDAQINYDAKNDIEMVADYVPYAQMDLYDDNKLNGYVTKSSEGIYFRYELNSFRYEAGKEEKVQVYINPGEYSEVTRLVSEENPNGGHGIEIALTSNNGICVFVNYYKGTTFVSNILWGTEVAYTSKTEDDKVILDLYVKYSVFGDYCGADFAIDADSVIGLGLNFWSDLTDAKLYSWYLPDMLGADGKAVVYHDNIQDWVRLAADGTYLYEGSSNIKHEEVERSISGILGEVETITQADLELDTWFTLTDKVEGDYVFAEDSKMHATWELNDKTLTIKYVGKSSQVTDNNEFWQFITFDNFDTKFDIRIKNGWAGVYNWKESAWPAWSATKIGNATYNRDTEADTLEITMTIDLTYFEDLGFTVEAGKIKACPIIKDVITLSYDVFKAQEGVTVAVPQFGYNQYEVVTQVDTTNSTWADLGTKFEGEYVFAEDSKMSATWTREGDIVSIKYVGKSSQVTDNNEFWQFITFDNFDTKFDIRFKNGWAGVYNWKESAWPAWNNKIGTATYNRNTDADTLEITMTIDLTYFSDLGFDINNVKVCPIIFGLKTVTYERLISRELESYEKDYNVSTTTLADGSYTLVIPANKINVDVINVIYTKKDYKEETKSFAREDFVNNCATYGTVLEEGKITTSVSGKVVDANGDPVEGAKVAIGANISTLTDANGNFALVEVDNEVAPYKLVVTKDGYYKTVVTVNDLISENIEATLEAHPEEAPASSFNITTEYQLIGSFEPDSVQVYAKLTSESSLSVKYVFAEGAVTTAPEEQLRVYFNFKGSDVIYSVRITNKVWVGIYNENTSAWETWNDKIGNPSINTVEGTTTIEQTCDITFFSDLGQDTSEIRVSLCEYTNNNTYGLGVGDGKVLSVTDASKFVTIVLPK